MLLLGSDGELVQLGRSPAQPQLRAHEAGVYVVHGNVLLDREGLLLQSGQRAEEELGGAVRVPHPPVLLDLADTWQLYFFSRTNIFGSRDTTLSGPASASCW